MVFVGVKESSNSNNVVPLKIDMIPEILVDRLPPDWIIAGIWNGCCAATIRGYFSIKSALNKCIQFFSNTDLFLNEEHFYDFSSITLRKELCCGLLINVICILRIFSLSCFTL